MSRLCRSVTPDWLVITEVALALAVGIAGVACAATKNWIAGFVLLAVAVLCGVLELLAALCLYSRRGHACLLDALEALDRDVGGGAEGGAGTT